MVALSEFVMKNCLKRPFAEKSRWRHIRLAMRPHYLGNHASQMKSYKGTLSGSNGRFIRIRHENCLKRPWRRNHDDVLFGLSIKPSYLWNHASQIKSYYRTLSGSHGRTFRIRIEKSREAPPGVEITMTSYPACNKNTLSRKPCIAVKKLLFITIRK